MPTPFEPPPIGPKAAVAWRPTAAPLPPESPATSPRSVFGNFAAEAAPLDAVSDESVAGGPGEAKREAAGGAAPVSDAGRALARAFVYRVAAAAFQDPSPESWTHLRDPATHAGLRAAVAALGAPEGPALSQALEAFLASLLAAELDGFRLTYVSAFGHAARGGCPLNEIEYGDLKADPLFQPHRLADLAAFYRAFGLEVTDDAGERHDHLCLELEFMAVLAAKEAYALAEDLGAEKVGLGREAQAKFLREHLGRWTPAFTRRLAGVTGDGTLGRLATFLRVFLEAECRSLGVKPGSQDLLLRPVDEAADALCTSCGLAGLPPGALAGASAGAGV